MKLSFNLNYLTSSTQLGSVQCRFICASEMESSRQFSYQVSANSSRGRKKVEMRSSSRHRSLFDIDMMFFLSLSVTEIARRIGEVCAFRE
mmetsp:Transcript_19819/g.29636  ORF Transcript_19819/g.29636 Transcript_19819/m.29636 type:complete len:90 (-) Transcript_19819:269-538(-)